MLVAADYLLSTASLKIAARTREVFCLCRSDAEKNKALNLAELEVTLAMSKWVTRRSHDSLRLGSPASVRIASSRT